MRRYEIADEGWEKIKNLLPSDVLVGRGSPPKPNRDMLNGILWIAKSGAAWRDMPERFGPWQTVYERFTTWSNLGVFETIFDILSVDADMQDLSIDSSSIKVHQHAADAKKGLKTTKLTKK